MPVWDSVEDAQLLKLAKSGEPEAFGAIYERYAKVVFRFLYAHLDSRLDAEDLVEEVFLRVWRALPGYRDQGTPFTAFLFRVAHNALIDHYRRSGPSAYDVSIEDEPLPDFNADPAVTAARNLQTQELRQVLLQLREDYRDVLILRFLGELSPSETAETMDRSIGAIRVLQHRALAAMRNMLDGKKNGKAW